jgi:protein-tyrosine-phosphatase
MVKMKILFICKYNVFRSRVAEEYFREINKNRNISAMSRGIIMGGDSDPEQRGIAKKLLGIDINKRGALPVTQKDLIGADLIVIVANDIPRVVFDYHKGVLQKKIVIWKIRDEQRRNKKNINAIVLSIKRKVEELVGRWKQ